MKMTLKKISDTFCFDYFKSETKILSFIKTNKKKRKGFDVKKRVAMKMTMKKIRILLNLILARPVLILKNKYEKNALYN